MSISAADIARQPRRNLRNLRGGQAQVIDLSGLLPSFAGQTEEQQASQTARAEATFGTTPEQFQAFGEQITPQLNRIIGRQQAFPQVGGPGVPGQATAFSRLQAAQGAPGGPLPPIPPGFQEGPTAQAPAAPSTPVDITARGEPGEELVGALGTINAQALSQAGVSGRLTDEHVFQVGQAIDALNDQFDQFQAIISEVTAQLDAADDDAEIARLQGILSNAQRLQRQASGDAARLGEVLGEARTAQGRFTETQAGQRGTQRIDAALASLFPGQDIPSFSGIPGNQQATLLSNIFQIQASQQAASRTTAKAEEQGRTAEEKTALADQQAQQQRKAATDFLNGLFPDLNVTPAIFDIPSGILNFLFGLSQQEEKQQAAQPQLLSTLVR